MRFLHNVGISFSLASALLSGCSSPSAEDLKQEERFQNYYSDFDSTPAHYRAKMIKDPYWISRREALTGSPLKMSKSELRQALNKLESEIQMGRNWNHPLLKASIPFTDSPPAIDGILNSGEWDRALSYQGEYPLNSDQKIESKTEWKLQYDSDFLYFAVQVFDDAVFPGPDDKPYLGDSVELFLRPDSRLDNYLEIVVSPEGNLYMTWAAQTKKRFYDLERFQSQEVKTKSLRFSSGYCIEGKVPFHILPGYLHGNKPEQGHPMNFMFLRCDQDRNGKYSRSSPVPFLYDGHNIYGYICGTLSN